MFESTTHPKPQTTRLHPDKSTTHLHIKLHSKIHKIHQSILMSVISFIHIANQTVKNQNSHRSSESRANLRLCNRTKNKTWLYIKTHVFKYRFMKSHRAALIKPTDTRDGNAMVM
jgi:hypothetical protein